MRLFSARIRSLFPRLASPATWAAPFEFRVSIFVFLLLAGCAPQLKTAEVPGCAPAAAPVVVPKGCYSTVFDGALEVRCDDRTVRYVCPKSNE
jgi:hypothetical protein